MKTQLDQIIVIDLESTCWDSEPPPGQLSEIIEIGLCPLDITTGKRGGVESLLVRPTHSRVSSYCTKLTTLTQELVDTGVSFARACDILQDKYSTSNRVWASFGDYDRRFFKQQCIQMDVAYPFGSTHINIRNLLAVVLGLAEEPDLDQAFHLLNLPREGTLHRGGDDAWNIASLLSMILLNSRGSFQITPDEKDK